MAPIRRPAAVAAAPPPPPVAVVSEGVNFGDLGFYAGGFTLPEGRYALDFDVRMHAGTKQDGTPAGPQRLGVMITAYPLAGGEPHTQFMSMGGNAHQSFAPNPQTGKGLVKVPGGTGANQNNKTNWALFLKSLYDAGLPNGVFTNDFAAIDGVWVVTQNVPEPEERKTFGAARTGEAQQEERRAGLVPVVSEIIEGGKPWEGGGGFEFAPEAPIAAAPKAASRRPAAAVAAPVAAAPAAAPASVRRPAPAAVAAPVAEVQTEELDDQSLLAEAINAASKVLEGTPTGLTKLLMRTSTFKELNKSVGGTNAQTIINTYFASDDNLNIVLGQLGFVVSGVNVVPAT